uniref:LBH domain-containing protein n=1 Tax=Chelonoidis abingdonii TaxID=106734 RepID=A0A8C0JBB3_CHEAB
ESSPQPSIPSCPTPRTIGPVQGKARLPSIVVEPTEVGEVESGELRWPPDDFLLLEGEGALCPPDQPAAELAPTCPGAERPEQGPQGRAAPRGEHEHCHAAGPKPGLRLLGARRGLAAPPPSSSPVLREAGPGTQPWAPPPAAVTQA